MTPDRELAIKYPNERAIYSEIKGRCLNPSNTGYGNYGARGITLCDRWFSFANFINDMGPRPSKNHSVERNNVNGNYEPGNCRWATRKEQANNRRDSLKFEWNGETKTCSQWSDVTGIPEYTLKNRLLYYGWPVEEALTTPVLSVSEAGARRRNREIRTITFQGETLTLRQWAIRLGMTTNSLLARLSLMTEEEAVSKPRRKYPKTKRPPILRATSVDIPTTPQ